MDFVSLEFYAFLIVVLLLYYIFPKRFRWFVLLVGSVGFYAYVSLEALAVLGAMALLSYLFGMLIDTYVNNVKSKPLAWLATSFGVIICALPLCVNKIGKEVIFDYFHINEAKIHWIVPLGLSFFTLQIIAYLVDIYRGKIRSQNNLLKYFLFVSYFPQIIQGPIPRYERLGTQLFEPHKFDTRSFAKGLQIMLWGFFLKLMIADKAAIVVSNIWGNYESYSGVYYWLAVFLYIMQLYTDFMACVCLAQGISSLFGIELDNNFRQPFLSRSIKELWGRWHITLGAWLRDYVYIPLGGSRHGVIRKYLNLIITFLISGIWHGTAGVNYLIWGGMQAVYQIGGDITRKPKQKIYELMHFEKDGASQKLLQRLGVFFWFMISVVFFRASTLPQALDMLKSMFTVYNPWVLFDDSLFELGLIWKEWAVLIASLLILLKVSLTQEKMEIREWILDQPLIIRWGLYFGTIAVIFVFGTYGFGFNAQDFIYGGF
ncbi:MAG: MBOAT family protein [Blautia sp.]|nr:MBOAT family protein [Blautia sp.]